MGAYALAVAAAELRPLVAFPVVGGLLVLAAALAARWAGLVPWGLALVLAAYAAGLVSGGRGIDVLAPLVAAGLLLAAELAYWSLEVRSAPETRATLGRRLAVLSALAAGTAGLGTVLLAASFVRPAGGPLVLALGVAAAVAALALLARLARASAG